MIKKISKYHLREMIIEARKYCKSMDIYSDLILSCLRLGASNIEIIGVFKLLGFEVVQDDK